MNYLLSKNEMNELFQKLSREYQTFGTVERDGEIVFDRVDDFELISEGRSKYVPKEFLIRRNENLLILKREEKKAVFGVKSCDLKGFYIMDRQILGKDPFYTEKRRKTIFINYVCREPCDGGFCSTFGGPVLDEYDIQVLREGDKYHVAVSDELNRFFERYRREDGSYYNTFRKEFNKKMTSLPMDGIEGRMKWNSRLWKDFASTCISCGACNFSCPTCYCFDVYDEGEERKREWDSCILSGFTSTSAGNIRKDLEGRLRQRFYHKFVYFKKSRGEYLCTGCNRCLEDCPVGIDIKEVITHDYSSE